MFKPSPPAAPDPAKVAGAQASSNMSTAITNAYLGNVNQSNPWGSLTYEKGKTQKVFDPNRKKWINVPTFEANVTLNPAEQKQLDAERAAELGMTNLARDYTRRIGDATSDPFTLDGMPGAGQYTTAGAPNAPQYTTAGAPDAPQYDENFRREQRGRIIERNTPEMEADRRALEQRLVNQGVAAGSTAWQRAMDDYSRGANDFRLGADIQAGQEAGLIFGMQGNARDRAVAEAAQKFQMGGIARDRAISEAQRKYDNSNATRDRAIQEALMQRNQPINEVTALLHGGGGVAMPQFQNVNRTQVDPVDVAGINMGAWNANMQRYGAQQSAMGGMMGGLGSLAGTGLGLAFSDRRVKKDIEKVGKLDSGLPLYTYHYKDESDDAPKHMGVMAQDVERVKPEAVGSIFGVKLVDYAELFDA